jgi:hypothetical protein
LKVETLKSLQEALPSAQYIVTVTVKAATYADTSSNFIFAINQPPYDGTCVFEPPLNGPGYTLLILLVAKTYCVTKLLIF